MNEMVPGLAGGKMSSSDPNSKIDFLDSPASVKKKIKAAFCEEGNIEDNGLLSFVKAVLIPIVNLRREQVTRGSADLKLPSYVGQNAPEGTVFTIERDEKYGGPTHYSNYEELELEFKDKKVHPGDLKKSLTDAINALLEPIQRDYEANEEWKNITAQAYPDPTKTDQTKKKAKVSTAAFFVVYPLIHASAKVYHPPPPGKGKQAKSDVVVEGASVHTPSGGPIETNTGEHAIEAIRVGVEATGLNTQ